MISRSSAAAPILAALAIVLTLPLGYIGGYFWLGVMFDASNSAPPPYLFRLYRYEWLAEGFRPAAKVESWFLGGHVQSVGPGRIDDTTYLNTFHTPSPYAE